MPGPLPPDGRSRIIGEYPFEHHRMVLFEHTAAGATSRRWALSRDGQAVAAGRFTTVAALKDELGALLAEQRRERAREQARPAPARPEPEPESRDRARGRPAAEAAEPRAFVYVVVGIWEDHYPPRPGQFVKAPWDRADPDQCPVVPCHGHKPRAPGVRPRYVIAKKVPGEPDLAVVEAGSFSLEDALEKAERIEAREWAIGFGIGDRPPSRAPADVEPAAGPEPATPREQWAVVRVKQALFARGALVEAVAVFPDQDQAELYALGKANLAVFPQPVSGDLMPEATLLADEVESNGVNGKKLTRLIQDARRREEARAQQREEQEGQGPPPRGEQHPSFGPELRKFAGEHDGWSAGEEELSWEDYAATLPVPNDLRPEVSAENPVRQRDVFDLAGTFVLRRSVDYSQRPGDQDFWELYLTRRNGREVLVAAGDGHDLARISSALLKERDTLKRAVQRVKQREREEERGRGSAPPPKHDEGMRPER